MSKVSIENRLIDVVPLDRRGIFEELNKGCEPKLLNSLVASFWVNNETDSNEDLGFVFALKPLNITGESIDGYYKLYISCVLPYAALSLYLYDKNGGLVSSSIAVDDTYLDQFIHTRLLKNIVTQTGYEFLTSKQLSEKVTARILKKLHVSKMSYFSLLFSE